MHPRRTIIFTLFITVVVAMVLSQVGWMVAFSDADGRSLSLHLPLIGFSLSILLLLGAAYLLYRYILRDVYRISDELTLIRAGKSSSQLQQVRFAPLNRLIQHVNQLVIAHHVHRLAERPSWLTEHDFVVFDTETTGLRPSHGDEIISIGAVKITGGELQAQLYFNEFVNPGIPISEASRAIHGIDDAQVAGARGIDQVLADFHAYCGNAILVGHNVAFDMRFLKLKEGRAGVQFNQPVLDTLLIASVLGKHLRSHDLNELAGLLGVTLENRHAALGDAIITARLFLILAELSHKAGFKTLDDLTSEAQKSPYAGLSY